MKKWSSARIRPQLPTLPVYKASPEWRRSFRSKTEPHLLRQLREMREHDEKEGMFGIDAENKVVSTEAGRLPMSPVMDPTWADAVGRPKASKQRPSRQPVGRFQKLLSQNIYALALSTDIRACQATGTMLPKHFLQPFGLMRHPDTKAPWWTPADLVDPSPDPAAAEAGNTADEAVVKKGSRTRVCYTLSNKSILGRYQDKKDRQGISQKLVARSNPFISESDKRTAVWREGMDVAVLELMRRDIVSDLAKLAQTCEAMGRDWVSPLAGFNEIKGYKTRGCVLWRRSNLDLTTDEAEGRGPDLSPEDDRQEGNVEKEKDVNADASPQHDADGRLPIGPQEYATYDAPNAQYFSKVPVYNLELLLGKEQLLHLMEASSTFRDNPVVLLVYMGSQKLQLKLWKLHGYLAPDEKAAENVQRRRLTSRSMENLKRDRGPLERTR